MKTLIAAVVALAFSTGAAFAADSMSKDNMKSDKPAATKKKASTKAKAKAKKPAAKTEMKKDTSK